MKFLERDLEEIIMNASSEELYNRGLDCALNTVIKRNQVRIGKYGIADIITYSKEYYLDIVNDKYYLGDGVKTISIYELKRDNVSISSFAQACIYIKGVKSYLKKTGRCLEEYRFKLILIGRKVDRNSAILYLPDIFNSEDISIHNYEYSYDIDGLKFKNISNYSLVNNGFKL